MNIQLDQNFKIQSDAMQYILLRNYNGVFRPWSYHTRLESALNGYFESSTRLSKATTIAGLLEYQKSLLGSLKQALAPLKIEVKEALKVR